MKQSATLISQSALTILAVPSAFSKVVDVPCDSNKGKVTLVHGAIVGDKPVKVAGNWIQDSDKNR